MTELPPRRDSSTIEPTDFEKEVCIEGWVQDIRALGGIAFVLVRDRDGVIQIAVPKKKVTPELFAGITGVPRESVIRVNGVVKESKQAKAGFEIVPSSFEVLSEARSPLPMGVVDKVSVEFETRFNNRYMDLRKPEVRAVFEIKSLTLHLIDHYLTQQRFVEVFTPKIVASGAEGGATLFKLDYFGKDAYLAQSPQLYKQMLMSTGLDRVYEMGPAFRAEPFDTIRHVSEFVSFDAEMAHICSMKDVTDMLEGCIDFAVKGVAERGKELLARIGAEVRVPPRPYPVLTYVQAVEMLQAEGYRIAMGEDLATEGEKLLGDIMEKKGNDLYWIVEYPEEAKPFYIMEKDGTPFSYSFDLDYRGQEIASGGQREHRHAQLVDRMRKKGLDPDSFQFYLSAFAYGMPPHGGWGLGLERLVQKMLGLPNIRETILFPRDRYRLVP
ncbi:MAG TPA: aspartate--tRNA(Asn) ligase [Methanomassiliicoccales archaeon]|nr:aspartate--tRNA(Asn) ligase [Methanomassiliicoccales archaeon]